MAGAQIPHKINYQGLLTNSGNAPFNGTVSMAFKLFNVASGGSPLYTEQQTVNVTNGVFNVLIGSATALPLPFDVQYYLGVTVGTDPEMTPRSPLAAAPYAIRAGVADNLDTLGPGDVQRRVAGICTGGNAIQTVDANGNVGCVAVGTGDITSVTAGSGLTGGATAGDVTLSVDNATVQRRGGPGFDISCPPGQYVRAVAANGSATCAADVDTDLGFTSVTNGPGISHSIDARNVTINNTGVTSITGSAPITASASTGGVTIGATVGTTAGTLAAGDHGHNMACGFRTATTSTSTSVSVSCSAGEVLTGGGCRTSSQTVESYPFQSCPPFTVCNCPAGGRCTADSWNCRATTAVSLTAYAMCCDRPVRGNIP